MRASIACPFGSGCRSRCAPAAIRNCHSTRSRSQTSSVTGCSTCRRAFSSIKAMSSAGRHEELNRPGVLVADRSSERRCEDCELARAAAARVPSSATLRSASDAASARSSRARRAPGSRRGSLQAAAPRRGAHPRRSARSRCCPRPKAAMASRRAASMASSSAAASRTTRMPRPPPPAAALTISGYPSSSGSPLASVGTPERAADVERGQLVAGQPERRRGRADPDKPGRLDATRELRLLGEEPVARVHGGCATRVRPRAMISSAAR